ncbi:MAG TPA: hypothetical protein VD816_09390 [Ohtaekwangia sp.]|nr:hypothetical protein [Ohtaekwangia sp.]
MRRFLLFVLVLQLARVAGAQHDTTFVSAGAKHAQRLYEQSIGPQSHLLNGPLYLEVEQTHDDQFPFFLINDWVEGTVDYDDQHYENVPLLYDIALDQIVTEHPSNATKIRLVNEKVAGFTLGEKKFIRITGSLLPPGYYEVLYPGKSTVYAKHKKSQQDRINDRKIERSYDARTRYHIFKNGTFFSVRSKSSVLEILSDRKRELKQMMQQQRMKFNTNREKSIVRLAEFYDSINP